MSRATLGQTLSTMPFKLAQAEREIKNTFGDDVSTIAKSKSLLKFGRNADVGTAYETVWEYGGDETYATTNVIDTISSSNDSDTATITIEYHTVVGTGTSSVFTFGVQSKVLTGRTKALLDVPCARVSRIYVSSGTVAGDIYVYEDDTIVAGVPQTAAKVHCTIDVVTSAHTQSFKCATTFSGTDYAIVTGGYASVDKKTSASVDFVMEVAQAGGVFRPAAGRIALNSAGLSTQQIIFDPYVVVPKNADFRIRAIASTTAVEVDASFQCYLAKVV